MPTKIEDEKVRSAAETIRSWRAAMWRLQKARKREVRPYGGSRVVWNDMGYFLSKIAGEVVDLVLSLTLTE